MDILRKKGRSESEIDTFYKQIVDAFDICCRYRSPLKAKKISLNHAYKPFNKENQARFMFAKIRRNKFCVLRVVDTGTGYGKTNIVFIKV